MISVEYDAARVRESGTPFWDLDDDDAGTVLAHYHYRKEPRIDALTTEPATVADLVFLRASLRPKKATETVSADDVLMGAMGRGG